MKKELLRTALSSPQRALLVDEHSNVILMPQKSDDTVRMRREPTSLELRLAKTLYEALQGEDWDDVDTEEVKYWLWVKTAAACIQDMRALPFDIAQKIRGKPFHNAKDIWETIIDAASPEQ